MYLLFDIGGTKMRLAVSKDLQNIFEPKILATPQNYEEGISLFKNAVQEISGGQKVEAIAGGIAGPFDEKKRSLVGSPNLKDWIGKPFKQELEKICAAPVFIENDTAMVGLGEACFGAGRGYKIVAYLTLSTGMGGCRIVDGKIDEKTIGFEPGHQIIDAGKTLCPECDGLYLGQYISGRAIFKRTGKKPEEIDDPEFWRRIAFFLAYGLNNTIVHWSPEIVVLGGSLMNKIEIGAVQEGLANILKIFPEIPILKKAELADTGGLWGAMVFLQQKLGLAPLEIADA